MLKDAERSGRWQKTHDPVPALKALAHPMRYGLIVLLAEGEKCVCDLVDEVGASQPLVSHHLAVLKKAGLVGDRHEATWTYYSLNPDRWESLQRSITGIQPSGLPSPPCPQEDGSR